MKQCRLCLQNRQLCNSHVVSEFLYKPLYDPTTHQFFYSSDKMAKRSKLEKGVREYLLCADCEIRLNRYETYAASLLEDIDSKIEKMGDKILVMGVNYKEFKLFEMSLLWRAGISTRKQFSNVNLGKHEERLRQMIFVENPGEVYEYGVMIILTPSYFEILRKVMIFEELKRFKGHLCYPFTLAGFTWIMFVSNHLKSLENHGALFLSKNGALPIIVEDSKSRRYFAETFEKWITAGHIE